MNYYVISRKGTLKLAWHLFWFATGTKRVGIVFNEDKMQFDVVGDGVLKEVGL